MTAKTPKDLTVEAETQLLFQAVGAAISQWAFIERELAAILTRCLAPISVVKDRMYSAHLNLPSAILFSVDGFRLKLEIVDAAVRASATPEGQYVWLLECWARIKAKLNKTSHLRNALAHWAAINISDRIPGRRAILAPGIGDPSFHEHIFGKKPGYTYRDIQRFQIVFAERAEMLRHFGVCFTSIEAIHDRPARRVGEQLAHYDQLAPNVAARLRRLLPSPRADGWDEGY